MTGKNYKLQDLLTPKVEKAFLSSFVYDWEWLESLLGNYNVVFAMHSRELKGTLKLSENRIAVIPPLGQYGCMHIKLLLLWYPGFMRLILPSANLIQLDWEDLENIVYFQDFPRISSQNDSQFYKDLVKILRDLQVPKTLIDSLENVDFSKARGRLVSSIPGKFSNQEFLDYGACKLSQIIQEISPGLDHDQEVYYQVLF